MPKESSLRRHPKETRQNNIAREAADTGGTCPLNVTFIAKNATFKLEKAGFTYQKPVEAAFGTQSKAKHIKAYLLL
ncbi:hypothetical protein [Bacteroides heparinolyticus]|uniref:hypothetical protein n=1 Tax=Prevotella heparinolytica TaxID=28113 RepID=UPI0028E28C43|nr:hypothetical protein [Bacteroides heparinolyticus]